MTNQKGGFGIVIGIMIVVIVSLVSYIYYLTQDRYESYSALQEKARDKKASYDKENLQPITTSTSPPELGSDSASPASEISGY